MSPSRLRPLIFFIIIIFHDHVIFMLFYFTVFFSFLLPQHSHFLAQWLAPSSEKEHSLLQATDAPLGAFPFWSRPSHLPAAGSSNGQCLPRSTQWKARVSSFSCPGLPKKKKMSGQGKEQKTRVWGTWSGQPRGRNPHFGHR